MRFNEHDENGITFTANTNTLTAVLILQNNYQVSIRSADSIGSVLGFNPDFYRAHYQESQNPVNILT